MANILLNYNISERKEKCKVWLNYSLIPTFDGVGCAVLAKLAFDNEFDDELVDIEFCNYDDIDDKVAEYFNNHLDYDYSCYITDISIDEELACAIDDCINELDTHTSYKLFDHHATALELNKFSWCKVETEDEETHIKTCGTELFYNWLVDNGYLNKHDILDRFVEVVRDYDTWRWEELGEEGVICKQVNDLLYLYGREKFIRWCMSEIHDCVFPRLYAADELVLKVKQKEIDDYIKCKNKQLIIDDLCGKTCGFVFAEKYASELGNKLCKMHPELDLVAMINMDGIISYRSIKDDIDLGKEIAQVFGGGGHLKSAGSQFSRELQMEIVRRIFE